MAVAGIGLIAYEATDTDVFRVVIQWAHATLLNVEITFPGLERLDEEVLKELEAPQEPEINKSYDPKREKGGADNARPIRVTIYVVVLVIVFWVWGGGPWV